MSTIERAKTVADTVHSRFAEYCDVEDLQAEIVAWSLTRKGSEQITTLSEAADDDGIFKLMQNVALQYAHQERAAKTGYDFEDLSWYSPSKIADLIDLARNPEFDGISGESDDENSGRGQVIAKEGGNLLAMVLDVRRAISNCGQPYLDPETGEYDDNYLEQLSDFLGGEFPGAPGYRRGKRRAMSNAAAQAITNNTENSEVRYGRDN